MIQFKTATTKVGFLVCSLFLVFAPFAHSADADVAPWPASLLQMGNGSNYYSPYAFLVDKKARMLSVWTKDNEALKKVAEFPADLGKRDGNKTSLGDHKTPEGVYFILERLEGATLDFKLYGQRAFTLSYPNFFDNVEGKTGNGIWLHAVPDEVALTRGSRGCVVVRNNVIQELTQYVKLQKTPVIIQDHVEYLQPDAWKSRQNEMTQLLDAWKQAWENKDIETYIQYYGSNFKALGMNRDQWKTFKSNLNTKYQEIKVRLSKPMIYTHKGLAVVRFIQAYQSDQHSDLGEKTLYLARENGKFKIVGEDWQADSSRLAQDEVGTPATASTAAFINN